MPSVSATGQGILKKRDGTFLHTSRFCGKEKLVNFTLISNGFYPDLHPLLQPLLDYFISCLAIHRDRGDLAECGKKRNIDYNFPAPLYGGRKLNKIAKQIMIFLPNYMWPEYNNPDF